MGQEHSCDETMSGLPCGACGRFDMEEREAIALEPRVAPPESGRGNRGVQSIVDVLARWIHEGPIPRVPTQFIPLDEACHGGLPVPWRLMVVGAPSAGKTAFVMVLLRRLAEAGLVCGMLGVDEEPDDLAVRAVQMLGVSVEHCEGRDPEKLAEMMHAAEHVKLHFYDYTMTIEAAAADGSARARAAGKRAVLAIDSIQTARCEKVIRSEDSAGPREVVEANMEALRAVAAEHRMLVVATSEANRSSYRSEEAAKASDEMAAGKESSSIEYAAQTLLMLRTPKKYPNHVRVFVPKNRRGTRSRFEFYLRLDRERHELVESGDPTEGDAAHDADVRDVQKRASIRAQGKRNAKILANVIRNNPGMGERQLLGALQAAGHGWGPKKLEAAKQLLAEGLDGERLVNRGAERRSAWTLERCATTEGGSDE
jgi:KaiC/GvpD/RAD55 family RecA-like ATPase